MLCTVAAKRVVRQLVQQGSRQVRCFATYTSESFRAGGILDTYSTRLRIRTLSSHAVEGFAPARVMPQQALQVSVADTIAEDVVSSSGSTSTVARELVRPRTMEASALDQFARWHA